MNQIPTINLCNFCNIRLAVGRMQGYNEKNEKVSRTACQECADKMLEDIAKGVSND